MSYESNDKPLCPVDCPNRVSRMGKGYSYLFAFTLAGVLVSQSVGFKTSRNEGWTFENREISPWIFIPCCLLIAGALGVNTDPLAEALGKWLSREKS